MLINPVNSREGAIRSQTKKELANMRMDAEIRIINNEFDKRSVNEIITEESAGVDLTFLGIAPVQDGKEREFIERTDVLLEGMGTVVLVKASSFFNELHIGL